MSFGDITKAGHWLRLKNIYAVAKPLSEAEVKQYFYRTISELYYIKSLLFYYKLDEYDGLLLFDSSSYANHITLVMDSTTATNYIYWDHSWEMVMGNSEVYTLDHVTHVYRDKALRFVHGSPGHSL